MASAGLWLADTNQDIIHLAEQNMTREILAD